MRFLVTSAPGLEKLLTEELRQLGTAPQLEPSGAVTFEGDFHRAAKVLIHSRIAGRVYLSLRRFAAKNKAMLYHQVRRIDWPGVFPSSMTFAVQPAGSVRGTDFALPYAALRIKDAVCDEFRKRDRLRPNVARHNPDVLLNAFFIRGRCELSMDLCGEALHRRGYRLAGAIAPMRENRAAALLQFVGYDGSRPLVDPFCGSGTIAIEGALIATRTAPGVLRKPGDFALVKLFPESKGDLEQQYREAKERCIPAPKALIRGMDLNSKAIEMARANAARAGMAACIRFDTADARALEAPHSFIVANPPFGERLEDRPTAAKLLKEFTRRLKNTCSGSTLGVVIPRGDLEPAMTMRPEQKINVDSGTFALRYLKYSIFAPSADAPRRESV